MKSRPWTRILLLLGSLFVLGAVLGVLGYKVLIDRNTAVPYRLIKGIQYFEWLKLCILSIIVSYVGKGIPEPRWGQRGSNSR